MDTTREGHAEFSSPARAAPDEEWPPLPIFSIVLSMLVAIGVLMLGFRGADTKFDELALGKENISNYPKLAGDPIHCKTLVDAQDCIGPAKARGLPKTVIWLGNSQLHAINRPKRNEVSGSAILAERLRRRATEALGLVLNFR